VYKRLCVDWCSNPGGVSSQSEILEGCSWRFDASQIDGFEEYDMSKCVQTNEA